jgi:aryl-alcohol dehydrogenase-like predicted oxidoreductase
MGKDTQLPENDFRKSVPRFSSEAMEKNLAFVDLLKRVAQQKNATPAQIALAWLIAQRPYIVPIPGTTKLHRLEENLGTLEVDLSAADLHEITESASHIRAEGERYSPQQLAMVGREAPAASAADPNL